MIQSGQQSREKDLGRHHNLLLLVFSWCDIRRRLGLLLERFRDLVMSRNRDIGRIVVLKNFIHNRMIDLLFLRRTRLGFFL